MKTLKYKSCLLACCLLLGQSCSNFGDINIDPNNTTSVAPETLLTSSLRNVSWITGDVLGTLYAQYISEITYTEESRYQSVNFDFNGYYTSPLMDLEQIITLNTDEATREDALASGSNNNQIAVAKILQSYFYHHMTDRWGPLPYDEALKGRADFRPTYNSQQDIYQALFAALKDAIQLIDNGPTINGDILFNGEMERWKTFANSIRLIAALRLSEVDASTAQAEFIDALNAGVISNNDDNIMYRYLAETNNENPWYSYFKTRTDFALSNTLVNKLIELNDPRLYSYGDPTQANDDYNGMIYGIDNPAQDPADVSFPNSTYVRAQDAPLPIITYTQILFSKAEAAHRGWIDDNAEQLYYKAIKASMRQWEAFDEEVYADYIAKPEVAWDAAEALALIGEQKWIALFLQGYEAWSEWRRTGYPELKPAPDALNANRQIPLRHAYPTTERDINSENWQLAVDTWLGGEDALSSALWWDVR